MKRFLYGLALCAAGAAGTSFAADDTGAWYVSPMVQWTLLHPDRKANDDAGFQVGVGKNFAPNWAAEINIGQSSFDAQNQGRLKLTQYSVDLLRKFDFLPDPRIQPYLIGGVGGMDDKVSNIAGHTSTFAGEVGGGLLWSFGHQDGSKRLLLRTEAKYRREFGSTTYGASDPSDTVFGIGLQYLFGAPEAAAPAAAAPPPPAEPPPPPPPVAAAPPPPPLDSDGDGVPDSEDLCPNTPKGDKVDVHGCTIKSEIALKGVNFETDSAVLLPESTTVLNDAVSTLKKHPELVIEVDGHTDNRGSVKHNLVLSQKRAESVLTYLQDHGVTNKLTAKGFGKAAPIADNNTESGRLENRRVSLKIAGN